MIKDWQVIVVMLLLVVEKGSDSEEQVRVMKMVVEVVGNVLGSFFGVRRRFDWIGIVQGCYIIDDYVYYLIEVCVVF